MTSPFEMRTMKARQGLGSLPSQVSLMSPTASSLSSCPRARCVFHLSLSFGAEAARSPTCI